MRRLALGILLAPVAACSHASPRSGPTTAAATTAAITTADLRHRLEIVADDSMQGREAGRLGSIRATDYVAHELARLRLEPAGGGGTWFQNIPLVTRGVDPVSVLLAYAPGAASDAAPTRLTYPNDLVPLRPIAGVPFGAMFHGARVPVVYGGRLGDASLLAPEQAKGKLVIFAPRVAADGAIGAAVTASFAALGAYREAWGVAVAGLEAFPAPLASFLRQSRDVLVDPSVPSPPAMPGALITTAAAERS